MVIVFVFCICIWCTKYLSKLYLGESISVTSPLSERKISLFLIPNLIWFRLDKEKLEKKTDSGVLAFNIFWPNKSPTILNPVNTAGMIRQIFGESGKTPSSHSSNLFYIHGCLCCIKQHQKQFIDIICLEHFRMGGDWEEGEDEPFVVLGEVVSSDNGDHAFTIQRQVRLQ